MSSRTAINEFVGSEVHGAGGERRAMCLQCCGGTLSSRLLSLIAQSAIELGVARAQRPGPDDNGLGTKSWSAPNDEGARVEE